MIFSRLVDRLTARFTNNLYERLAVANATIRERDESIEAYRLALDEETRRANWARERLSQQERARVQATERAELLSIEIGALNEQVERLNGSRNAEASHFDRLQADIRSREAEKAKRRKGRRAHV